MALGPGPGMLNWQMGTTRNVWSWLSPWSSLSVALGSLRDLGSGNQTFPSHLPHAKQTSRCRRQGCIWHQATPEMCLRNCRMLVQFLQEWQESCSSSLNPGDSITSMVLSSFYDQLPLLRCLRLGLNILAVCSSNGASVSPAFSTNVLCSSEYLHDWGLRHFHLEDYGWLLSLEGLFFWA